MRARKGSSRAYGPRGRREVGTVGALDPAPGRCPGPAWMRLSSCAPTSPWGCLGGGGEPRLGTGTGAGQWKESAPGAAGLLCAHVFHTCGHWCFLCIRSTIGLGTQQGEPRSGLCYAYINVGRREQKCRDVCHDIGDVYNLTGLGAVLGQSPREASLIK